MFRPGANAIDHTLEGVPRDYADPPAAFGHDTAKFRLTTSMDPLSWRTALAQHDLAVRWRSSGRSGAQAATSWGFSRQTWSRTITGQRWAGQLGWIALSDELALDRHGAAPLVAIAVMAQGHAAVVSLDRRVRHELRSGRRPDTATLRQLAQLTGELGVLLNPARLHDPDL